MEEGLEAQYIYQDSELFEAVACFGLWAILTEQNEPWQSRHETDDRQDSGLVWILKNIKWGRQLRDTGDLAATMAVLFGKNLMRRPFVQRVLSLCNF